MLGSGRFDEMKKIVQTSLLSTVVLSFLLAVILFRFSSYIAVLLGADDTVPGQIRDTAAYLRGYALGIPAIIFVGTLMSMLQLEGKKKLTVFWIKSWEADYEKV